MGIHLFTTLDMKKLNEEHAKWCADLIQEEKDRIQREEEEAKKKHSKCST